MYSTHQCSQYSCIFPSMGDRLAGMGDGLSFEEVREVVGRLGANAILNVWRNREETQARRIACTSPTFCTFCATRAAMQQQQFIFYNIYYHLYYYNIITVFNAFIINLVSVKLGSA